jgi:hypothetical protein
MTQARTGRGTRRGEKSGTKRRLIAVGKRVDGRWQVRTSLWRYVAATGLSAQ